MNYFKRPQTAEDRARAYCREIKADPDEAVWGQRVKGGRFLQPRWCWYVGASLKGEK